VRLKSHGILGAVAVTAAAFAFSVQAAPHDNDPTEPFAIGDGVYYVGASDIASYLFKTKAGLILIDGGYATTAPQILKNIRTLGFDPRQVKILLSTHAHFDHAGGLAQIKRETGAAFYASKLDGDLIAHGGRGDFFLKPDEKFAGGATTFEPVMPDRTLVDGQKVTLGEVTLTAHLTPGHTKGCTTWTFPIVTTYGRGTRVRQAMILCSNTVLPGYRLAPGQESYPGITADFEKSYAFWRAAPCDVFLASHGKFFNMQAKREELLSQADGRSPFDDPDGCKAFFDASYTAFEAELAKQKAAAK
jgi:metallo-beta-lactamase class B